MQIWREDYIPDEREPFLNICIRFESKNEIETLDETLIISEVKNLIEKRSVLK